MRATFVGQKKSDKKLDNKSDKKADALYQSAAENLSDMSTLHFRVRHGRALHCHKNRAAKIFVVCEPYPVSPLPAVFSVVTQRASVA